MNKNACKLIGRGLFLMLISVNASADQVVLDNLIIDGSQCVGTACTDNEAFDFDTVIYKANDPSVRFVDTSSSSSFPTND